jgi:hypothetical protein
LPHSTVISSSSSSSISSPEKLNTSFHKNPPFNPPIVISHSSVQSGYYIQSALAILRKHIDNSNSFTFSNKESFENKILEEIRNDYVPIDNVGEYFDVMNMLEDVLNEEKQENIVGSQNREKWIQEIHLWFKE